MKRNNKTEHWTDGDQIGRKLTGKELATRLKRLATGINGHHAKVDGLGMDMLEHAMRAGEYLLEAETRLGGRLKWSRWRKENFKGSKETALHYMRIAREWNNPLLVKARRKGANSINAMLNVLRRGSDSEKRDDEPNDNEMHEMEIDLARQEIRQAFAAKVRKLDDDALPDFRDRFDCELWPQLLSYLDAPSGEYNPNVDCDGRQTERNERAKTTARQRVSDALNLRRDKVRTQYSNASAIISLTIPAFRAYVDAGGAMDVVQFISECLERPGGIDKVYLEEGLPID